MRVRVSFLFAARVRYASSSTIYVLLVPGLERLLNDDDFPCFLPAKPWKVIKRCCSTHPNRVVSYLFYAQPTRPAKFMSSESLVQSDALPALPHLSRHHPFRRWFRYRLR